VDGDYKAQCEINIRGPYPTNNVSADKEFMGVTLSWDEVQGATSYSVLWGTSPDEYPNRIDDVASPLFLPWVPFEQTHYFTVVTNSSEGESINADAISVVRTLRRHSPEWASHIPTNTVSVSDVSEFQIALSNASAGDWIKLEGGIYNLDTFFQINASGTVNSPIWITPEPGASVELTRPDANQNTVNIGTTDHSEYLIFHGLEFSAGSDAVKLSDCSNIWIDNCTIHDCSNSGISANSENTSYLYITDNEIYNAGGTGCGIYLGGNNEEAITHHSIVADNYIHDITGTQGEGIELKYGSYANRITDNRIHTCNYSCIAVFGTNKKEFNIIERNILYDSNESVLFVTGESVVRNNLVIAGGQYSFYSTDSGSASVKELSVLHNTFINSGDAVRLRDWSGRSGLVFANNACYSQNAEAINTVGTSGVSISGNVVFGSVSSFPTTGYIVTPNGIADFVDVAWDGSARNAAPSAGSTLLGAADTAYAVDSDLYGKTRTSPHDTGAVENSLF
jgi:hypothetical protein